jgi:hypothetical protein
MIRVEHEMHGRRRGRNMGTLAILIGFVAIMFGLSVVKITHVGPTESFDHVARPALAVTGEERGSN